MAKPFKRGAEQFGLLGLILAPPGIANDAALHDHLRAGFALRLQQHRVHVHARWHACSPRLQRLRPSDFTAVRSNGGIVSHVLGLERPAPQTTLTENTPQSGDQKRAPYISPGNLQPYDS